jgi:MinD superfamily P-loop ATPase
MHEIVILSGKGGTGKTSIAASLAMIASEEVIVADCDVDAANMHLLLEPVNHVVEDFYCGYLAVIDKNRCSSCGECERVCRFGAVKTNGAVYFCDDIQCEGCGYCEKICPENAIKMESRRAGQLYVSSVKSGTTMVHARLEPGGENSGKLVAKVKNEAGKLLKAQGKEFVLVDGSPGIGCPVVSSLSGASIVIIITEPSISALNDMKRLYQLLDNFKIPSVCLINKCDLDPVSVGEIKEFLDEKSIPLIAEVPFNQVFTDSMVNGKSIVEVDEILKLMMIDIWKKVKHIVKSNKNRVL